MYSFPYLIQLKYQQSSLLLPYHYNHMASQRHVYSVT